MHEHYIGDGVYVKVDGFGIEMYTSDGIDKTNIIYLEPQVALNFIAWFNKMKSEGEI